MGVDRTMQGEQPGCSALQGLWPEEGPQIQSDLRFQLCVYHLGDVVWQLNLWASASTSGKWSNSTDVAAA